MEDNIKIMYIFMCVCVCVCVCVYDQVTSLHNRNWHNIINHLYFNKKKNFKKEYPIILAAIPYMKVI